MFDFSSLKNLGHKWITLWLVKNKIFSMRSFLLGIKRINEAIANYISFLFYKEVLNV